MDSGAHSRSIGWLPGRPRAERQRIGLDGARDRTAHLHRRRRCLRDGPQDGGSPSRARCGFAPASAAWRQAMKPAPFDYYAPTTVEGVCKLLAEAGGGATVLAGGQTLMPLLALR